MTRVLAAVLLVLAADRQWQTGKWGTSATEHAYVILHDAYRLELEDAAAGAGRPLDARPGTAVKFAVEKDDVYVLDRAGSEHKLHLVRRVSLNYSGIGGGHYIKVVGPDGQSVTLEDGSVWEIDPRSHFFTQRWDPLDGISIRRATPEDGFNYEIDNIDQDNGALARYSPP